MGWTTVASVTAGAVVGVGVVGGPRVGPMGSTTSNRFARLPRARRWVAVAAAGALALGACGWSADVNVDASGGGAGAAAAASPLAVQLQRAGDRTLSSRRLVASR